MKSKIVAGNWKLNKGPQETNAFATQLCELLKTELQTGAPKATQLVVFPQTLVLASAVQSFSGSSVAVGGQNIYSESTGAFTGENSAAVLRELGATHVLIGHSERRQIFGETDMLLAKKMWMALKAELLPVFCVGETLEQRQSGQTESVLTAQLQNGLAGIDRNETFWVAYEPVWAIGTGQVASPQQASEAHAFIRSFLGKTCEAPILYGGSVKPENAMAIAQQPHIDGFLVGGASLDPRSFFEIAKNLK